MLQSRLTGFVFASLVPFAFIGCSDQSPVAPSAATDSRESAVLLSQPVLGQYDLEFLWSGT